jgi:hypothetical protein
MMEKTWEIKEKEIREEIAQRIEGELDGMMPPVDEVEIAVYTAMTYVVDVVRGLK